LTGLYSIARVAGAALLAGALLVAAQTTTEQTIQTDTVDLFRQSEPQTKKSPGLAMFQSIVLPGLGHQYLGMQDHAIPYFATEALFVFGAIFCEQYSARMVENSHLYAMQYADAKGGGGADSRYWQNIGDYLDLAGYNNVQELNGTPDKKYVSADLKWTWADTSYMNEYRRIRSRGTNFHVASTFFIGAMVLDRVIAFVDTRATTKFARVRKVSSIRVTPEMSADGSTFGATLSCRF
jgi:hypothetical protein